MSAKLIPWTAEEIKALEDYQKCGYFHPYTCGNNSLHENLIPTPSGWVCPNCDYKQNWAHQSSMDVERTRLYTKPL